MPADDDLTIEQLQRDQPDHVGLRLWHAEHAFLDEMMRRLADRGYDDLTPANTNLLPYLDIEGTRITTLAERAGITKQAVGQSVRELAKLDYLRIAADPTDGRAKRVRYTKRGLRFVRDQQIIKNALQAELAQVIGKHRMSELMATLDELAKTLRR